MPFKRMQKAVVEAKLYKSEPLQFLLSFDDFAAFERATHASKKAVGEIPHFDGLPVLRSSDPDGRSMLQVLAGDAGHNPIYF